MRRSAADDTAAVIEYATVNGSVLAGAGADQDADGDTLAVSQVSGASGSFAAGAAVAGRFGTLTLWPTAASAMSQTMPRRWRRDKAVSTSSPTPFLTARAALTRPR